MRAPLRAMQSYAALLEEESGGRLPPQSLEFLRRIRAASRRMDRLIQDSLDYTKILRQEMPLQPVDIFPLLRDIIETYPNLQSARANISLEFDRLVLLGNESAFTQVFSNLLGNAVKFVAPGVKPRVRVWAEECGAAQTASNVTPGSEERARMSPGSAVRVWIEDNGIGIPDQARSKIFGMFQRMHREDEYPGTGIGLAVVRKALERMGGQAGFESELGKGSRFWLELPRPSERVE